MEDKSQPSLIMKVALIIVLLASMASAISVVVWAQKSDYCLVDVVDEQVSNNQLISILEDYEINHKYCSTDSCLLISLEKGLESIEIIGPNVINVSQKSTMACQYYLGQISQTLNSSELPFWKHPRYYNLIKLVFGGIAIIAILMLIVSPLLRIFLSSSVNEDGEANEVFVPFKVGEVLVTPTWFSVIGTVFWSLMYLIALTLTQSSLILDRYDTSILAISVLLPLLSFYQIFNGLMSVQFYGAKLVFNKNGFTVESGNEKKIILWSNINKVKIIAMSSVIHIYDRNGERVYSVGTDLSDTNRLIETLKLKTNLSNLSKSNI
jgi:hypothetical protein